MTMWNYSLFFLLMTCSTSLAQELPQWHPMDVETKEIGHFVTDPRLKKQSDYWPTLASELKFQEQQNLWREQYLTPLLNASRELQNIYNNSRKFGGLDAPDAESSLKLLNAEQNFSIKVLITDAIPSQFQDTLPTDISAPVSLLIVNPELPNDLQISNSRALLEKTTEAQIAAIHEKSSKISLQNPDLDRRLSAIVRYCSRELRPIFAPKVVDLVSNASEPLTQPIVDHIAVAPPLEIGPQLEANSEEVEAVMEVPPSKSPWNWLLIVLPLGAVVLILTLGKRTLLSFFKPTRDIETVKEAQNIQTAPAFGCPRGAYVTSAVSFASADQDSSHARGKLL